MAIEGPFRRMISSARRLDRRPLRERLLVNLLLVVIVAVLIDWLVLSPTRDRLAGMEADLASRESQAEELRTARDELAEGVANDPVVDLENTEQRLQARIGELDREVESVARGFVSAGSMAEALREMLADSSLRLVSLTTLPAERIHVGSEQQVGSGQEGESRPASAAPGMPVLYRHPLEITFEGRFAQALDYLQRVQALPWDFQWDGIEVQILDYPRASFTWRLHSISLEEALIGG
jgi:MSHA biogenesis protein MshJ